MLKKKDGRRIFPVDLAESQKSIVIKNGRIIDPANGLDTTGDVFIENGIIVSVGSVPEGKKGAITLDASEKWVVPGLMDMHVHLREPGREDKETIETGTMAASAGGFTAVACMPNTDPVLDSESKIRYVVQRGANSTCRIYPMGSITKKLQGEELTPFDEMIKAGACAVTDDGKTVKRSDIMRNAFNYSKTFDIPVCCHCEDADLVAKGCMNESAVSTKLGLRGIPSIAEEICVARDIMLAEYTGARVHICHVSTAGSVNLVRWAKKRGVKVTAESCPHYFTFTDEAVLTYDTFKKMNPPLRGDADREAIIEGLKDGTIDVIASDHAPHTPEEKDVEFDAASFGVIGLETMVGASITNMVKKGHLTPSELIKRMSVNPHTILKTGGGTLSVGKPADIAVIDPDYEWTVESDLFFSKGKNSAFLGEKLTGAPAFTILAGRIVYAGGMVSL